MKRIFATLAIVLIAAFAVSAQDYTNKKIAIGQKAPELAFQNPEGKTIKLTEIAKGRVVLLDFWASWCRPCRGASPALVALYNKYKDQKFKGAKNPFTVVSVSLDQNKDAWVKAIADDHLDWPYHMSDLKSWSSDAATTYGVQWIPQCFLIDASGKVVGKYMTAGEAIADLDKLMSTGKVAKQ